MGASSSLNVFNHLQSKSCEEAERALNDIWKREDKDNSQFLDKKEAEHYFHRAYAYLTGQRGKKFDLDENKTVAHWWETYNRDGKITFEQFRLSVEELVKGMSKDDYHVILLTKIALFNLPTLDSDGKCDPVCRISYPNREDYKTYVIVGNNNPVWRPDYVFVPQPPCGELKFTLIDEGVFKNDNLGSFSIDVSKIYERFASKDSINVHTATGTIQLSKEEEDAIKKHKRNVISKFEVEFEFHKWGLHFGFNEDGVVSMNPFNKMFWIALKKMTHPAVSASEIEIPNTQKELEVIHLTRNIRIATEDLTLPRNAIQPAVDGFCRFLRSIPVLDEKTPWGSRQEGIQYIARVMGPFLPPSPEGDWKGDDVTSNKFLKRTFFQGVGATLLTRSPSGEFVADFEPFKQYKTRPGYVPYQGKVVFTPTGDPKYIIHNSKEVHPKDDDWELAKYVMRSNALMVTTAADHLMKGHFIWSNLMTQAVSCYLTPEHPIRRLICIHTYRAAYVNRNATLILVPEGGALNRCMSFEHPELLRAFDDIFTSYRFEPFPEHLKNINMTGVDPKLFPLGQDALDYYDILNTFVKEYIAVFYDETELPTADKTLVTFWNELSVSFPNGLPPLSIQSLVSVLTQFIFMVTGWHTQVGNVSPYSWDPAFAGPAMGDGHAMTLPQVLFAQNLVTLATAGEMPMLMQDYSHMMVNDESKEVLYKFQKSLDELSQKIDERNKTRTWVFNSFNPKYIATSIAV